MPDKIQAVTNMTTPTSITELQCFLGMCNFLSKFFPRMAEISEPLHQLTCNGIPFIWGPEHTEAFQLLKREISTAPILRYYNPKNFHMAHPVPSYPHVLVNRTRLCNCHLESGLTYVLKSLGSCSTKDRFTMYFSINSAFNHYMSSFGFSSQNGSSTQLLTYEPVFDIFLNKSLPFRPLNNDSATILPLNPPDTLLKLFQSLKTMSPNSPNSPFFPIGEACQWWKT